MASTRFPVSFLPAAILVLIVTSLAGCAIPKRSHPPEAIPITSSAKEIAFWPLTDLAFVDQPTTILRGPHGIHGTIHTAMAKRLLTVANKVFQSSGADKNPVVGLFASGSINAAAFFNAGEPTITVSLGMVHLIGNDDDAWAALIGHELAHFNLGHHRKRSDRNQRADNISTVASAVLSWIGLPFASVATDATAVIASRAFNREDELDADRVGLEYMRSAGYVATGAIRLQQMLLTSGGNTGSTFLSTHPGGEDRIENIRQLMHSGN